MRYLGGKHRLGPKIAAHVVPYALARGLPIWDAFCGGLSTAAAFARAGATVYCSDKHPGLIAMYQLAAVEPIPEDLGVDEALYAAVRTAPDEDPFKAFAGFGCSFGGRWFEGFARTAGRDFASESARAVNRDVALVLGASGDFACLDFMAVDPSDGAVLYLDPPYAGTTKYAYGLDHAAFWARAAEWAAVTGVFVSEYAAPAGWECIAEWSHALSVAGGSKAGARTERLFFRGPA